MSLKPALVAACIVAAGLVMRLPGLGDPPLDFHPTRQYRAAIIARGYSLDLLGGLEPGAREMAASAARGMPPIEPPVMEIRAVAGPDSPPFGSVDAPADPVTLGRDPVLFQGWALDDTSMKRVWIGYVDASGRVVPLGDAIRDGRRPDVAAAYPTAHDLYRAAWAFTLDPSSVRDIPRPIHLKFFGEDGSGQRAEIGRRTVR